MDLIYTNSVKEDVGVMPDYTLDLAFGSEENDFECVVDIDHHVCQEGYYLYYEGSEYGGIIDTIKVNTEMEQITYAGRTWHGILQSKILEPDPGQDYLVFTGEANQVLEELIYQMGLEDLFSTPQEESGIQINAYQMDRYIEGYDGIRKMLKASGGKLTMQFKNGWVELAAKPIVNYAESEQFEADQVGFDIEKKYRKLNHVIGLGKGELKDRLVVHVYADADGNTSDTQTFTGVNEVTETYEMTTTEDADELKKGCAEKIATSWNLDEVEFSFESDLETFDVGDVLTAKEQVTGITVTADITKKIVTINEDGTTISYKVGE